MPNPTLLAFHHQLDLTHLKEHLTQDDTTATLTTVNDGLLLFSNIIGDICTLWIDENLLIVYADVFYHNRAIGVGDSAIIQAQYRQNSRRMVRYLMGKSPMNFSLNLSSPVQESYEWTAVALEDDFSFAGISPVDTLSWSTSAFGKKANYHFKDGYLHGPFSTLDSAGLLQQGYYDNGYAAGLWQYYDTAGQLQYTEEYAIQGELQRVKQEPNVIFQGTKPLPTLRYLWNIHRLMFCLLCLLLIWLAIRYLMTFRQLELPYIGQSLGELFVSLFVISPVLSLGLGFFTLVSILFLSGSFGHLLGWDLPLHFLNVLQGVLILPMIECGWLWITNRFQDVTWHSLLAVNTILILGEWHFLQRLASYVV